MPRFQPGDLALVVACPQVPENVGCVVELIQRLGPGDLYVAPSTGETREAIGNGWLVVGRVRGMGRRTSGEIFYEHGHALFTEKRLMPLRGYFLPASEKTREVPA